MDAASVPSSSRRHLDSLLSKLRPFQRSAYEFAVGGVLPNVDGGGGDGGGSTKCSRSKENLAVNNDGGGASNDYAVAAESRVQEPDAYFWATRCVAVTPSLCLFVVFYSCGLFFAHGTICNFFPP